MTNDSAARSDSKTPCWKTVIAEAERHLHTAMPVYFLLEKPKRGRRRQKLYSAAYDDNTERLKCDAPDGMSVVLAAIAVQVAYEPIGLNLPGEMDDDDENDTEPMYEPYYRTFRMPGCPDWAWGGVWLPEALRSRLGLHFGMVDDDYQPTEPRFVEALRCAQSYVTERCAAIWRGTEEADRVVKEEVGRALNRGVPAHISRDELISEGHAAIAAGNKATRLAARNAITDRLRRERVVRPDGTAMPERNDSDKDEHSWDRRAQHADAVEYRAAEIGDDQDRYDREDLYYSTRAAAEELPERQQEAIRLIYFESRTEAQAAAEMGISQQSVSKLLVSAFEAIRSKVGKGKH